MATVVWSVEAIDEIEEIRRYIETDSIAAATRLVARILSAVEQIALFPDSGRMMRVSD